MPAEDIESGPNGSETPGYDFEKIKADVLEEASKDAAEGSHYVVFHGFYNHDNPRRRYARVTKGDFSGGYDQSKVEYDENLTAEDTDNIRNALYEQFGATPPPDEEFDKQKKPSEHWRDPREAIVDTPTNTEGVVIQEVRLWRVLSDDIAAEHGIDPLDFTQWGIRIINKAAEESKQETPEELGSAAVGATQIPVHDGETAITAEELEQSHREALVEDANRVARGGIAYESDWAGDTVKSLREDLQAQLEFTEAYPEVVDALMTAAKADAFDSIAQKLGLFTRDNSRRPDRGKVPLRHARNAAEEARAQSRKNNADVWHTFQTGMDLYNRSLTFALQELVTGDAQRPYKTKSTGPGRNDYEIIGRHYDGPHVRTVIDDFLEKHPDQTTSA